MILSTSFVSLMSTTNFFFLWLDRFTQLLNTSSVVISLEFVLSNLRLTVSENILSLSLQESPNLFTFRVVSLSFLGARDKWANNGSRRSMMTDWRRQTGRQAFFFRVIGSSSARVKERLAEVLRVPLLAQKLLGVFDTSLCDEVVVGLKTCGRNVLGQGAKVLSGSAQGICPPHRGSWRCRAVGTAGWSERWWGRRRNEWRCRRDQKQHSTMRMKHVRAIWDECELEPCPVCVHLNKEKQSRDADSNNKEERLQEQTSSAVVQSTAFTSHWMYSWVSACFNSLYMLLGLSFCVSSYQFNYCQCTKLTHFLICTGIPCRDSHCENGLVRSPSVSADRRQL